MVVDGINNQTAFTKDRSKCNVISENVRPVLCLLMHEFIYVGSLSIVPNDANKHESNFFMHIYIYIRNAFEILNKTKTW